MLRSPVFVTLALLALGSPPVSAEDRVVEWVVASDGFPGTQAGSDPTTQVLAASQDRLRILDPEHQRAVFLSLADRRWYELLPLGRRYRVHELDELVARRERSEAKRQRSLGQLRRQRERLVDRDDPRALRAFDREVAQAGLRLDERPDRVRLERFPQDRRTAELIVDGEPRQVTLDHYQVRINQAAEPVCELWTTRDLELPVDLLAYYRGVGLFSPAVVERLSEVPGVVVEARVHLQAGVLSQASNLKVERIRTAPSTRAAELVPVLAGWTEVVEPSEQQDQGCAWCGGELPARALSFDRRPFCSSAHRKAYMRR